MTFPLISYPTRGFNPVFFRTAVFAIALSVCGFAALAQEVPEADPAARAVELFNEGQTAHEKGDLKAAIGSYKEALALIPEFPEAEFQLATAYRQTGDQELAERSFRRAVELRGDWSLALAGLGAFLVDTGRFGEAEPILVKAAEIDEQNFPALSALAELRLQTKAGPETLRPLLVKVAAAASGMRPPASIVAARGSLERELGDIAAAKKSFERTLEIEPANRTALGELALIAIANGDLTRADGFIKKLESVQGVSSPRVAILRARHLLAQGRNAEADRVLAAVSEQTSEIAELRARIAAVSSTDVAALERQAAEDPKDVSSRSRLCSLYRIPEPEKAASFCRQASELEPNNIDHAVGYGAALVQAKHYPAAIVVLKRLSELAPENSTVRANLATALFYSNRFAEAKTEYRWLAEKQPDLVIAYYFLGIVHDRLGEYLDAAANYQQFLKVADAEKNKLEIERINLRMPSLQRQIKEKRGK